MTPRLLLLGAVAALGSLAIQMVAPVLPMVARGIGASTDGAQLVIAVYLIGMAGGQFAWAPVADAIGRRAVLLASLGAFLAGTLLCALAPGLPLLLAGRLAQALGASGSLIAARSMATDLAAPGRGASSLAVLTGITLISPAIAPVIGGALAPFAGWRSLFWLLAALSLVASLGAMRWLPETLGARTPIRARAVGAAYRALGGNPVFLRLAAANTLVSSGFYLFLAVAPFILAATGKASPTLAGLFYSVVSVALIVATLTVPAIERRAPNWLRPLSGVFLAGGSAVLALTAATGATLLPFLAGMCLVSLGSGLNAPTVLADAMALAPGRASIAASLFGATQMAGAAVLSTLAMRLIGAPVSCLYAIAGLVTLAVVVRPAARHAGPAVADPLT